MGIGVAVASVALGAEVIEKHFTTSRADGGVDSAFSMEPAEMKALVVGAERAREAMGAILYGVQKSEEKSVNFKRSIFASRDIEEGEAVTDENVRIIRPGTGIAPKYYDMVLGARAHQFIKAGTPLSWDLLLGTQD